MIKNYQTERDFPTDQRNAMHKPLLYLLLSHKNVQIIFCEIVEPM